MLNLVALLCFVIAVSSDDVGENTDDYYCAVSSVQILTLHSLSLSIFPFP